VINISNSSPPNPGQFTFTFDTKRLALLGLSPNDIYSDIASAMLGIAAGTITIDHEDRDVVVRYPFFEDGLSPDQLMATVVMTKK